MLFDAWLVLEKHKAQTSKRSDELNAKAMEANRHAEEAAGVNPPKEAPPPKHMIYRGGQLTRVLAIAKSEDAGWNLTNAVKQAKQEAEETQSSTTQPTDERVRTLRKQADTLNRDRVAAENTLSSAAENTTRLKTRVRDLQTEEQKGKARNVIQLRLPKEHSPLKQSFQVVLKNDQLYFVYDLSGGRVRRNTYALNFDEQYDGDIKITPIRGRGVDLRTAASLLRNVDRSEAYIVCWVYSDSFRTFNQFKQIVIGSGYEYGWNPMEPDSFLTLTDRNVPKTPGQ